MSYTITEDCNCCGNCEPYCREGAINQAHPIFTIDEGRCTDCGSCVEVCSVNAIINSDLSSQKIECYRDDYIKDGLTPLMISTIEGDHETVLDLLEGGADPTETDKIFGTSTAIDYAKRQAENSEIHGFILINLKAHEFINRKDTTNHHNKNTNNKGIESLNIENNDRGFFINILENLPKILYILGFISLILAPFTGVTIVSAAAFFVIAYILDKKFYS